MDAVAAAEEAREAAARRKALQELKTLETSTPDEMRQAAESALAPRRRAEAAALAADYRLLGLRAGADLASAEEAWRRLAARADPKRFPSGSEEERRAAEILKSINEAYERIRESLIPTEGRFGQLEL